MQVRHAMFQRGQKRRRTRKGSSRAGKRRKTPFGGTLGVRSGGVVPFRRGGDAAQALISGAIFAPGRLGVKFVTTERFSFTSTSGAFGQTQMCRLNSVFDPWNASGSSTVSGYVNWFGSTPSSNTDGVYMSYMVVAAKLEMDCHVLQSSNYPMTVGLAFRPATRSAATTWSNFRHQYSITRELDPGANGGNRAKLSLYGSIAGIYGDTRATVQLDDSFAALSNANPASECYADFVLATADGTTTQNLYTTATLTQWVIMFGPKRASYSP